MNEKVKNLIKQIKNFFNQHNVVIPILVFCSIILTVFLFTFLFYMAEYNKECSYSYHVYHDRNMLSYYNAKEELVAEVENYILSVAPNSSLNAITLVEKCDEYNVDIIFVLAQAQKESHFGTKGLAVKTNSVFNVFAFDNYTEADMKALGKTYIHPDFSIEPYLKLLTTKYFVNGKTEMDMFDQFVDKNGMRYASYEGYERDMRILYSKIDSTTSLSEKIDNFNKYKLIIGI